MFNKIIGYSRTTFLKYGVVRASDHDRFNDNMCSFCRDSYHEDHRAARVSSCDHVFGRDCLEEMTKGPNGDLCPICRSQWFQPPGPTLISRLYGYLFVDPRLYLVTLIHLAVYKIEAKIEAMSHTLPAWMQSVGYNLLYACNVYRQIDSMIKHFTNLYARNPGLRYWIMSRAIRHNKWDLLFINRCFPLAVQMANTALTSIGMAPSSSCAQFPAYVLALNVVRVRTLFMYGVRSRLRSRRDRAIFVFITGLVLTLHSWAVIVVFETAAETFQQARNWSVKTLV